MRAKPNVLVVDDDDDFRDNIIDVLESQGFSATGAQDGLQALERIKESKYDVALMDIKMPVMDGVEAFRRMKQIDPSITVIMITAYSRDQLVADAMREGAYAIYYKPVEPEQLIAAIAEAGDGGKLILVVDDDSLFLRTMQEILIGAGYRVLLAGSGAECLEKAAANNVDVYLIDIKMPVMNGLETYLRLQRIKPGAVAVMITGYRDETRDLTSDALNADAYTVLYKPLEIPYLLSLLEHTETERAQEAEEQ
ncbi:MAG: response regulator [Candidatus Geothermincolia bacterium]